MRTRKMTQDMIQLEKFSFGVGDRFGMQGAPLLKAIMKARDLGVQVVPVWNKSFREHQIIQTAPLSVREEADQAVQSLGYGGSYYVDADHVTEETVDDFIVSSDFFTIDVARYIGKKPLQKIDPIRDVMFRELGAVVDIHGCNDPVILSESIIDDFLERYYLAIVSAAELYRYLEKQKGAGRFIPEVSMDEVDTPQSPTDLLLILFLLAHFRVPVQTIAPKFSGRFNKGVDYAGDLMQFKHEFESDILVLKHSVSCFGMPANLKLSVHSGSDKFSIYPIIGELIRKHSCGIHIKTAGTTWLEEVIGLCLGDAHSLSFVKNLYKEALDRKEELCAPYADVIAIDRAELPKNLDSLTGWQLADMLRHIPENPAYNMHIRQLFHVGYQLAAKNLVPFTDLLKTHRNIISQQVEENIYERHILRLFS